MNAKTQAKSDLASTREAGTQDRKTSAFDDDRAYFREQQKRAEARRSLDTNYKQFSTLREIAPNYQEGVGLDAVPMKPLPGSY